MVALGIVAILDVTLALGLFLQKVGGGALRAGARYRAIV
jgi:hypothetical protein